MTVWEDLMNCVCQNAAQGPGVQEVLDSVERQTVCTDTACFEDDASAFGLTGGASAGPSNQNMFYMFMTCASLPLLSLCRVGWPPFAHRHLHAVAPRLLLLSAAWIPCGRG